ncbi:hypothetical protein [Neisseria elongata]|uniref:Uncharacterized protein n=2 Tax=Neisseria elongata subsp. glycolytica ATCC 29315 TaxID=546263 RepID=D4DN99_NEIEG|nr:hypothetical protein [Neisseria elongata]EFE50817.1 hypothetical protein NEIELOOT_00527 [Neisseria elongata subsp. glycolytica ATCC 29315]SQH50541.1 phage protein [Neisseria elongata subsp. glycolytica]
MSNKMEIIEHSNSNQTAMHSLMVMEQWGNGEAYNEDRWIERGRQAMRQTVEGMFELGRVLIVLKEHMTWEKFADVCEVFGMAEQLRHIKGRFLLSINDVPAIREIFTGFQFKEVSLRYSINKEATTEADELLIANYPINTEQAEPT